MISFIYVLSRYVLFGLILICRAVSVSVMKRFPTIDHIVQAGKSNNLSVNSSNHYILLSIQTINLAHIQCVVSHTNTIKRLLINVIKHTPTVCRYSVKQARQHAQHSVRVVCFV